MSNFGYFVLIFFNSNVEECKLYNEESCELKVREMYNDDDSKLEYD